MAAVYACQVRLLLLVVCLPGQLCKRCSKCFEQVCVQSVTAAEVL
jgi:hypothetical protein